MAIGCRVSWSCGKGCRIVHPIRGDLQAQVENGCPEIEAQLGLELIHEAEKTKLRRREAEIAVNKLVDLQGEAGDGLGAWCQSGQGPSFWCWVVMGLAS